MAILLEGKPLAEKIKAVLAAEVAELRSRHGLAAKLISLQIGENASSAIYVKNQKKTAESLGIEYELKTLASDATQADICREIEDLNNDKHVTAIILQRPVPGHINVNAVIASIDPDKDAEGMHPVNLGRIMHGKSSVSPCTAAAVMELLSSTGVKLYGREAVVVGHSEIVGKPLALMLLNNFLTTTICHIATGERGLLPDHVKRAEILIVAVGKPGIVKGDWVRDGAIVIDVGINKVGDKIVGDVEFEGASARASFITPVPGGVGPLTTVMLMRNTVEQFKLRFAKG